MFFNHCNLFILKKVEKIQNWLLHYVRFCIVFESFLHSFFASHKNFDINLNLDEVNINCYLFCFYFLFSTSEVVVRRQTSWGNDIIHIMYDFIFILIRTYQRGGGMQRGNIVGHVVAGYSISYDFPQLLFKF